MDLATQLQSALRTQSLPLPSLPWLRTLVTTRTPPPPLASLIATARTRILASDLTTTNLLDPTYADSHAFPPNTTTATAAATPSTQQQQQLSHDVVVQILDLENLNRSRWEQVEELEAIDRGEQTRGRHIIRLPTENSESQDDGGDAAATQTQAGAATQAARESEKQTKNATHKLVLQDCKGQKVYAIELKRLERIAVGKTNIGEKVLLKRGMTIARGVLLLEPANCLVLGGKVEAWHKVWAEGRLARLRGEVGADRDGR
ncbi:hypothetical protein B0T17DRAFT_578137 [Bombardia bombarda]|uniref:RecQ-mediated genome instability protein 1 n=1 Tax=Bombardia bombarda TaxID=252184 RepID=A0AA40C5D5_9PEZI|nr:hypothetical protein B0T17DRAFT_578137 [Bombardia bombarda]